MQCVFYIVKKEPLPGWVGRGFQIWRKNMTYKKTELEETTINYKPFHCKKQALPYSFKVTELLFDFSSSIDQVELIAVFSQYVFFMYCVPTA